MDKKVCYTGCMIISASRRTDIPAWYSAWFFDQLSEGKFVSRNPMRPSMEKIIPLSEVDGFVFWTKNPLPMIKELGRISNWPWYFQFTLTPYGRDMEPHLPNKKTELLPAMEALGRERAVWRYDPIVVTEKYSVAYHLHAFEAMAQRLSGFECVISLVDMYRDTARKLAPLSPVPLERQIKDDLLGGIADIGQKYGLDLRACCEPGLFQPGRCIDTDRLSRIAGRAIIAAKDKNQRKGCGCAASMDIGSYGTCKTGCLYCYARPVPMEKDIHM